MKNFDLKLAEAKKAYEETGLPKHLVRMRNLRVKFGQSIKPPESTGVAPAMKSAPNPFPDIVNDIPEMAFKDISTEILSGAIQHQGALIVRDFFDQEVVNELKNGVDEAFEEGAKYFMGRKTAKEAPVKNSPWFRLDLPVPKLFNTGSVGFMLKTGSVWTFLSPGVCHSLLSSFEKVGLRSILDEYFEGRTCVSFNKSVLRRMDPLKGPADWHQDGSFMSEDIKSLNLWVALSDCGEGTDCPGMDFVPKRLNKIMPTGVNKAKFDWSVSHDSVQEWFKDCPPVRPSFKAGDAIFFDHYNLHVTSYSEEYTKKRYALETWFFSEDYASESQKPTYW